MDRIYSSYRERLTMVRMKKNGKHETLNIFARPLARRAGCLGSNLIWQHFNQTRRMGVGVIAQSTSKKRNFLKLV